MPNRGPVLFVPNHSNALVDPLLIVIALGRRVTVTAKNVLAKNPLLGLLMSGLGVITFHRREDVGKGAEPRQNVRSLQRCSEVLAKGGAICVFPEGVSHSDPKLRPFRTGPARIAIDYLREHAGATGPAIVPVGLLYTEKERFRSEVWLRFGLPLDAASWRDEHPAADAHDLTDEIRRRVEALVINYETEEESRLLGWAAEIAGTRGELPQPLGQDGRRVADWFRLVDRLRGGYLLLRESHPAEIAALVDRIRRYRAKLSARGIDPAEVYLPMHFGRALLFFLREAELVLVGSPLAAFGVVNHIVPYQIVKQIARALSTDRDHWASNTVYPGFVVFPLFYLLELGAAWLFLPALWALVYTVALSYTGYYALLYRDRIGAVSRRTLTFFHFLRHRAEQAELALEGRAIVAQLRDLEKLLPAELMREPALRP